MLLRSFHIPHLAFLIPLFSLHRPALAAQFAWMEGETPASANVKFQASGWGHQEFLSGQKWLQVSIDADKVEKELSADGALLEYRFHVQSAGSYEIWNRIGYEFVRSPFDWRIDDGAWARISPDQLTTDLMELQDWNEVAWLKMGSQRLSQGPHKLFIRLPKTKDDKGKTARVLYASDALCAHLGPWSPYSHYKPGEDWRDAKDREVAKKVFPAPSIPAGGGRATMSLAGQWAVCRYDEQTPGEVAAPISGMPAAPHWKAIAVPSDKMQIPELVMAHRLWYRTRLEVPATQVGRSFQILIPHNNLNTTRAVKGVGCGFKKKPVARFDN
jgi:beta-galactosidase